MTLLSIAEEESKKEIDLINAIHTCMSKGWLRSDFYVLDAIAILRHYTSKEWTRISLSELPKEIKDNEYTEVIWYNKRTTFTHFRRRVFDTLQNSTTVREGKIQGYYLYTCKR